MESRREQERMFGSKCGKAPTWKKEVLLQELFFRASQEDRKFAMDYLSGKTSVFESYPKGEAWTQDDWESYCYIGNITAESRWLDSLE